MPTVQIQIASWDKLYHLPLGELTLKLDDQVLVRTDYGLEVAKVVGLLDETVVTTDNATMEILRLADANDLRQVQDQSRNKEADFAFCQEQAAKNRLAMKIIDLQYSLDGSRVTVAFSADGRVDFRELVKELTRHFNRLVRLQQIGARDEAKATGNVGHCGKELCCRKFLNKFQSITSETVDLQNLAGRGSDRLSGACGRLMCCLAFEADSYKKTIAKLPPIGTKVNVDGKRGEVVGHHIIKESVDVKFIGKDKEVVVVEVDLNRHKKGK